MDRIIEIKVGGNYVSKDSKCAGVRGEANVTMLRITFDESWDNYAKHITFWDARGENPVERILTADLIENILSSKRVYLVPIPAEPMSISGMLTFVIDGYFEGKRQRSMSDKLEVKDAPVADNAIAPQDPTPTQAEQLQAQIETILDDIHGAEEAKKDIENMSVSAETLPSGKNAFVEKSVKDGVVNLHFGLPAGPEKLGEISTITEGEGYASVQSVGTAKAITDYSVALGDGAIAGCRGYYIKSIDLEGKKIYLSDVEVKPEISTTNNTDTSFETPGYEVGAGFNIFNHNHYVLRAKIAAISNNVVIYDGDLGFTKINEVSSTGKYVFSVPTQPEIGVVQCGVNAASFGDNNMASGGNSIVAGSHNVAAGANGAVFGSKNVGGYSSLVSGANNYSPAQSGTTGGEDNENTGYCTDVHGWELVGNGSAQHVRGVCNIPDPNSKFLEIVGNGKSDSERANGRAFGRDGNHYHQGDVYVHTTFDEQTGVKDKGERLATSAEVNSLLKLKAPLYRGLQIADRLSYPKATTLNVQELTDSTGIRYYHVTAKDNSVALYFENYSITPRIPIKDGTVYFKVLVRTNRPVAPAMVALSFYDANGNSVSVGSFRASSEALAKGNGEWEQLIITVKGISEKAKAMQQVYFYFAGDGKSGSQFDNDAYFDVAGWAAFDDLDRANAYDLTVDAASLTDNGYNVQGQIDEKASKNLSNVTDSELLERLAALGYTPSSLGVQIAIGAYTGTGTSGSGNKNSLGFDIVPSLVIISDNEGPPMIMPATQGEERNCSWTDGGFVYNCHYRTVGGHGIEWYCDSAPEIYSGIHNGSAEKGQKNTQGVTYEYLAISY